MGFDSTFARYERPVTAERDERLGLSTSGGALSRSVLNGPVLRRLGWLGVYATSFLGSRVHRRGGEPPVGGLGGVADDSAGGRPSGATVRGGRQMPHSRPAEARSRDFGTAGGTGGWVRGQDERNGGILGHPGTKQGGIRIDAVAPALF
jgi:hypothetical protein